MALFYTTPEQVLRHPLNRPWGEIHAMSDTAFARWWAQTAHLLVQQYEQFDTPPKNAHSETELLAEFRRLCAIDPSTQVGRDFTDNTTAYTNTVRVSVADQFFKNLYEAKDRHGDRWISVMDQLKKPAEFVKTMTRALKHDGKYLFAPTVPRTTASLEDYLTAHREHSGFLFYQPANDRKKPLQKKYFARVSEVRRLIARGLLPKSVGNDLTTLKATEKVFLREYRKDERVFSKLFILLQTALISAPTNFPAVVARSIYSRYAKPRKQGAEVTIWDPSMGFGGRLLGALSLLDRPIHYIGTDPNSLNYFADGSSRYGNLELVFKSELVSRRDTFRGTYLKCGSEEAHTLPAFQAYRGKVDLVFTSPPYFSAELYHEEPTQSSLKFGTYQDWREHFLARTIQTGAEWLRKGGYLILNVANSGGHPIEDDVRIIARQLKLSRVATEKMLLGHSPGAGRKTGGHLTTWNFTHIRGKDRKFEPLYLFIKEHDTPSIKKFFFSRLHQPKIKSSGQPQVTPVSPAETATLKASLHHKSHNKWKYFALTPVQQHDGCYFKRDDLYQPFPDFEITGGKVRQCLALIESNLKHIKQHCRGTIATAVSAHSPQGPIVARVAKAFGLKCVICVGTDQWRKHRPLQMCNEYGAEVIGFKNCGRPTLLQSRFKQLSSKRQFFEVNFGFQVATDADSILGMNAHQVENLPKTITKLVIPVGSGVSAEGIVRGVANHRPDLLEHGGVVLIQPFGYERRIAKKELRVKYYKGKYPYATPKIIQVGDVELDHIYEAKAYDYFIKHKRTLGITNNDVVCFWVIANANVLRKRG